MALFRSKAQNATAHKSTPTTDELPETIQAELALPSGVPQGTSIVVTISRQCGSGGSEIGRLLAHERNLHYLDHEIIDEVARRSGVNVKQIENQDEQTAHSLGHAINALNTSTPFNLNYSKILQLRTTAQTPTHEQAYFYLTQRVILEMAGTGNAVIIGRGGQFLLRSLPRVLHVYVFAPLPNRIENVMNHFHLTRDEATEFIERRDSETENYLRHYYGSTGTQPEPYHLLINTGLFSFETAAHLIAQALPLAKEII